MARSSADRVLQAFTEFASPGVKIPIQYATGCCSSKPPVAWSIMSRWTELAGLLLMLAAAVPFAAQDRGSPLEVMSLSGISDNGCLLPGQRVQLQGTAIDRVQSYELLLMTGGKDIVLEVERATDTAISAVLPVVPGEGAAPATLVLRDRRSGRLLGRRLPVVFCAREEDDIQQAAPLQPSQPPKSLPPERMEAAHLPVPPEQVVSAVVDAEAYEARELIVFTADMAAARQLDSAIAAAGFSVKRRRILQQLELVISVIRLPADVSPHQAAQRLRKIEPHWILDANHRYRPSSAAPANAGHHLVNWGEIAPGCGRGLRLGLVDALVDREHPWLNADQLVSRSFLPQGIEAADMTHATAIASILTASRARGATVDGLLPAADLYSAGVFRALADGSADTTAELIITALDWLQGERVDVINLSLAGRPNRLLERAVEKLLRGKRCRQKWK
ncbi:MAG: S8 family serine peptidase [Thiogranum sp.]|nr:S8 family serine peptidase [Thiogranum sp.]